MNYPNMSYCMCQNTLLALTQVVDALADSHDGDVRAFYDKLAREEQRAFKELIDTARALVEASDESDMGF